MEFTVILIICIVVIAVAFIFGKLIMMWMFGINEIIKELKSIKNEVYKMRKQNAFLEPEKNKEK